MAKERLNTIDIAVVVANIRKKTLNYNLVNIYDVTNRIYVLKFSKNENKIYILIEIGCRIHITQFIRHTEHLPSNFNVKLRKHIRTKRLTGIEQRSQDRVIDFTFSSNEYAHHLIIQLFLPGNIYLTDHNYKVLAVLRPQNTGDNFFKVGLNYVFNEDYKDWGDELDEAYVSSLLTGPTTIIDLIRKIYPSVHSGLSEYVIRTKFEESLLKKVLMPEEVGMAFKLLEAIRAQVCELKASLGIVGGYLFKNEKGVYDDFAPLSLKPSGDFFEDYNDALDTFFTKHDIQKEEKKVVEKKPTKLKKIKLDQDKREEKLKNEIDKIQTDVGILEENHEIVDNCLNLLKTLIASGASWKEITDQLAAQRNLNHPVARYISSVDIPNQSMVFCAGDGSTAAINYSITCYQNLEKMYQTKKKLESKLERTKIGRDFALKKVTKEKENVAVKGKGGTTTKITTLRKMLWFEKFRWFITTDGYLVLGGRDALQNEILVKKYLTKGDLYFHADIHGASSCILKNPKDEQIPQKSIEESGCFAVCNSNAWVQKFMIPSWWVYHHQVSKTPPTGEFVPQGSFIIRGKKNYIQPQKLEMGIAIIFHINKYDDAQIPEETTQAPPEEGPLHQASAEQPSEDKAENSGLISESLVEESDEDTPDEDTSDEDTPDEDTSDEDTPDEDTPDEDSHDEDTPDEDSPDEDTPDKDSPDEDTPDEDTTRRVRIDENCTVISDIDCDIKSRTKDRRSTGYPGKVMVPDLESIKDQLKSLDLLREQVVRIQDPEKVQHSEEAVRKIRARRPTGFPKSDKLSKTARNKLKKIQERYGSDDEETQELRRLLTGSRKMKVLEEPHVAAKEDTPSSHTKVTKKEFTTNKIKTLDDSELELHMRQLNSLSKDVKEDDNILNAIPMCAPYSAISEYQYKIKLVPGNTKKGLIATQTLQIFRKIDQDKAKYIKLITNDQLTLTLISNCKMHNKE